QDAWTPHPCAAELSSYNPWEPSRMTILPALSRCQTKAATQHDRLLWGIQVQPHHIGHLFQKLRVARQLKRFRAMWLQIMRAPDIVDRGFADTLALCHGPATPVCHPLRFAL